MSIEIRSKVEGSPIIFDTAAETFSNSSSPRVLDKLWTPDFHDVSPFVKKVKKEEGKREASPLLEIANQIRAWLAEASERRMNLDFEIEDSTASFDSPVTDEESEMLENYFNISYEFLEAITEVEQQESSDDKTKLLAAYDKDHQLQGAAIVHLTHKKNGEIFVKVHYLLTAFWNMPIDKPKSSFRMKGTGTALMAEAIKLHKKSKVVFLKAVHHSVPFYEQLSFVETKKKCEPKYVPMKLFNADFHDILKKRETIPLKIEVLPF